MNGGTWRARRLLAGVLVLLWLVPGPALAQSGSDAASGDDYDYADEAEDAYDYGVDEEELDGVEDASGPDGASDVYAPSRWQRAGEMSFDLLFLRPLAVAGSVTGFGFFMVSAPFLVWGDQIEVARDLFMGVPGEYAFQRAIGDI